MIASSSQKLILFENTLMLSINFLMRKIGSVIEHFVN
ncbi:MAG: hypothetical protein CFH42_00651 [Alphaproteobacteria bacterium MarineAlpha12_Bin1]|nr:MAG: hypothetical protein CFH42_00651 [Alphaproteobacteria bacterium MarineAlpha12_Bin1]